MEFFAEIIWKACCAVLHNIYLTDTELEAQAKTIIDFLLAVHPELNNKMPQNACVELRPINRSPDDFNIRLSRSLNLWRLDDKAIDFLKDYLNKHNGQPYCMYYSVFAFDSNKEAITKTGKKAVKGKITSETALFTHELVLDFDNINYMAARGLMLTLEKTGLDGLWVFTGHGYQLHILLDKPLYDKQILYRMVHLFRAKGFMCDTSCVDTARLMRLPFTYNCKCFSQETYDSEFDNPPLCKIIKETKKRFSIADIVEKMSALETVSELDEGIYLASLQVHHEEVNETSDDAEVDSSEELVINRVEYPAYFRLSELPRPIVSMLYNTPDGFRNNVLGLLIKFCKQYLLLGRDQIQEIMQIWAEGACDPAYNPVDFPKDFERLYQMGGLPYSSELAKKFGYIDFKDQIEFHRDNKVLISNTVFQNLAAINGNVLRAYLAVKILEHGNGADEDVEPILITKEAISEVTGMAPRTLDRVLPAAKKLKLLYVKVGAKRKGEPNTYHSVQIVDSDAGFKALSVNDLEVYLSSSARLKLSDPELKLYLFMLYKFYTKDRAMSLKKMGEFLGRSDSTVGENVESLRKKRYLKVERIYKDNVVFYNKYTLLK